MQTLTNKLRSVYSYVYLRISTYTYVGMLRLLKFAHNCWKVCMFRKFNKKVKLRAKFGY